MPPQPPLEARAARPVRFGISVSRCPARHTTVHAGSGALEALSSQIAGRRVALLVDSRVARLHGPEILARLARPAVLVEVPAGERAKRPEVACAVWEKLGRARLGRSDVLVGAGGGATLDLTGFVASTWTRGLPWIAVATTLLAQVDACIGGKTALDLRQGKNLVGTFHPPEAAFAEPSFLLTQREREYRAALFEVLKMGWLGDAALRRLASSSGLARREPAAIGETVVASLKRKAALVAKDPEDRGVRRRLNLGHTFGHALEAASGFRLLHGEAVGVGLLAAAHASRSLGLLGAAEVARRRGEVLELLGPSGRAVRAIVLRDSTLARSVLASRLDKKRGGGSGLLLVLPTPRGAALVPAATAALFRRALAAALRDLEEGGRQRA